MPNLPFSTSSWSTHNQVGVPRIVYPIEGDLTAILVIRTYQGPLSSYTDGTLGTADAVYTSALFVEQGPLEPLDGGQVRYTRTFATVPANRTEFESLAFRYPGFDSLVETPRDPFTATVLQTVTHTYSYTTTPTSISLDSPFTYPDNYLTDDSDPTAAEYVALTTLTTECVLRRYYGNIWEKITKTIPAL